MNVKNNQNINIYVMIFYITMLNDYFKKDREKQFPKITNFSDPQDNIRFETNVNKLSWSEWFWLHPSAYNMMSISIPAFSIITFIITGLIGIKFNIFMVQILSLIFIVVFMIDLYRKIKKYKMNPNLTFYDLWLRDF